MAVGVSAPKDFSRNTDADYRAMAEALAEKSLAVGRVPYSMLGRPPRKAALLRSAWYLVLHPDRTFSAKAAADDAGIAPGTASSWLHRDGTLADEMDRIASTGTKTHSAPTATELHLSDSDMAIMTKAFGLDDLYETILAAAAGQRVDWDAVLSSLPNATRELLAEAGYNTPNALQAFVETLAQGEAIVGA